MHVIIKFLSKYVGKKAVKLLPFFAIAILLFFLRNKIALLFQKKTSGWDNMDSLEREAFLSAQALKNALGVGCKWYQVCSWSENEKKAVKIVLSAERYVQRLERHYFEITKRVMWNDLNRYLSTKDFEKLMHLKS